MRRPSFPRSIVAGSIVVWTAVAFLIGSGSASAQIFLGGVSPTWASTAGGPVIFFGASQVGAGTFTATIDGVDVAYFTNPVGAPSKYEIVPPPHAPGPVQFTVTVGGFSASVTLTYIDLPIVGLASPVERVSVRTDGTESTDRGNGAQGSTLLGASSDGNHLTRQGSTYE